MKQEIEARIAALEQELAAERQKLTNFLAEIPAEFHNLGHELIEKLKSYL